MIKKHSPKFYTRKGLPRKKHTITFEKLNTIRNLIPDLTNQQIRRAIKMGKTATKKRFILSKRWIKIGRLPRLPNPKN